MLLLLVEPDIQVTHSVVHDTKVLGAEYLGRISGTGERTMGANDYTAVRAEFVGSELWISGAVEIFILIRPSISFRHFHDLVYHKPRARAREHQTNHSKRTRWLSINCAAGRFISTVTGTSSSGNTGRLRHSCWLWSRPRALRTGQARLFGASVWCLASQWRDWHNRAIASRISRMQCYRVQTQAARP